MDIFSGLGSCDIEADAYFNSKNLYGNPLLLDVVHVPPMELETMKCLFYRMKARGAIFTDHLHGAVTHVVLCRHSHNLADRLQLIQVPLSIDYNLIRKYLLILSSSSGSHPNVKKT